MLKKNQSILKVGFWVIPLALILLAGCAGGGTAGGSYASLPAGKAWAEGQEIYFVHTEASDADVAEKLTAMMKSPVLHVPGLADAPAGALADVYVFTNGIGGKGPFGFQSDVFDNPPGTPGYSPLRRLNLVTWAEGITARELKAISEVLAALDAGEVSIEQPGVVINMPFVVWQDGKR